MGYSDRFDRYKEPILEIAIGGALMAAGFYLLSKREPFSGSPENRPLAAADMSSHYTSIQRRKKEDDVLRRRIRACNGNFVPFDTPQSLEEISNGTPHKGSRLFVPKEPKSNVN